MAWDVGLPVTRLGLLAFLLAAIVGEIATVALLWELGTLIAFGGMPFGGALCGVCAAGMAQRTYLGLQ